MDLLTELRVPTRSAPRPPDLGSPASRNNDMWSGIDPFSPIMTVNQKKKPPPRPPPPKFTIRSVNTQEKPKKPARPTELLTNLFGRRGSKGNSSLNSTSTVTNYGTTIKNSSFSMIPKPPSNSNTTISNNNNNLSNGDGPTSMCLIDLSPPGSPTPSTTRSNSDGVSVDSFGSDGNSNPSVFTSSSGSTSAFEDDFDFFGSLSTKKSNDPWKVSCSQDPFGSFDAFSIGNTKSCSQQWPSSTATFPTLSSTSSSTSTLTSTSSSISTAMQQQTQIKEIGESNFFAFNDPSPFDPSPFTTTAAPVTATTKPNFVMPTIIRPKRPNGKEPPPKPAFPPNFTSTTSKYSSAPRLTPVNDDNKPGWAEDASPPMPKLPPPPPPTNIDDLEDDLNNELEDTERPYGIALYDFVGTQPGDLDLKEGDIVYLTELINDNWMEGRVGDREGLFPVNFIDVKIPLPGFNNNIVTALYAFKAETSDDLSFQEGASIKVLSRVSDEWLYGECNGEKGQFPANFVDRVPSNLPDYHL